MVKKTLLQLTQDVLNDLDSDEVNSIDDTVESQQVANIIRGCYEEVIANRNWPHLRKLATLDSMSNLQTPTTMKLPANTKEVVFIRYDCQRPADNGKLFYKEIKYLYPDEFLRYTSKRNSLDATVQTVTLHNGMKLLVYNDQPPAMWTSFDDSYVVFDAYQQQIEDTLRSSKSEVLAYFNPVWVHTDYGVPDLPEEAFPMLVEEAKSTASLALKQMVNQKAEAKAGRQQRWLARKAWRAHGGVRYADYGRRRSK